MGLKGPCFYRKTGANQETARLCSGQFFDPWASKKCVTLRVPLFFVFSELRGNLLGMVCHSAWHAEARKQGGAETGRRSTDRAKPANLETPRHCSGEFWRSQRRRDPSAPDGRSGCRS